MTQTTDLNGGAQPNAEAAQAAIRRVAVIALFAIALGFAMQLLVLAAKLAGGGVLPGAAFLADLAQGVSWSLLVCTGVGVGTAIVRARAALAGLIAMLFAPVAVAVSKASQKAVATAIGAAEEPAVLSLASISALRAIEYGVLGWVLAQLATRDTIRAAPFFTAGAAVGIIFGGAIAALNYHVALASGLTLEAPAIAGNIVNEVLAPIGCAAVIYLAQFVGRNFKAYSAVQA